MSNQLNQSNQADQTDQTDQTNQTEEFFESPKTTTNSFADVNCWIKNGDIVVLKSRFNQFIFHDCEKSNENELKARYIIFDLNGFPSLLDKGEWPDFLKDAGRHECVCPKILDKINEKIKSKSKSVFLLKI